MGRENLDVLEEQAIEVLKKHPEEFTPPMLRNWMVEEFQQHDLKYDISALVTRLVNNGKIVLIKESFPDSTYCCAKQLSGG